MTNQKGDKEQATDKTSNHAGDLGGIMNLASQLLKDPNMMNAVFGMMQHANPASQGTAKPDQGAAGQEKDGKLKEIDDLKQEISEMKSQLLLLSKQNEALLELMQKINEKKSRFSLFSSKK